MIEKLGNLWEEVADVHVITTNGIIKKNGEAVMGAGIALQAKNLYPILPKKLAKRLTSDGNRVFVFHEVDRIISTLPTKHDWKDKSDINLIRRSIGELAGLADRNRWNKVVLPRPGCSNGQLSWLEVRPILVDLLDDRFFVINPF